MPRDKSIGPALTELAIDILDRVKGNEVPLETKLDAFKQLTAFHVGTTRVSKNLPEEPDVGSIVSLKDRIASATTTKVSRRPADPDAPQRDGAWRRRWKDKQVPDATNDLAKINPVGEGE